MNYNQPKLSPPHIHTKKFCFFTSTPVNLNSIPNCLKIIMVYPVVQKDLENGLIQILEGEYKKNW